MPAALFTLLACQLLGEVVHDLLRLPVPGPVLGMVLLTAWLALRDRGKAEAPAAATPLDRLSGALLKDMGLLFVPAGVGVIAEWDLVRQHWLPLLGAVLGSTVLGLAVTGWLMHRLGGPEAEAMTEAGAEDPAR